MPRSKSSRRKKNGRGGKGAGRTGNLSDDSLLSYVTRIRVRGIPFYVDQATSGNGGITSAGSAASLTAATTAIIDPFMLGSRLYTLAADFQEYKIEEIRFRYIPFVSQSGVTNNPAGPVAGGTATVAERVFAWGFHTDPAITASSFLLAVEAGYKIIRTCQPASLFISNQHLKQWRFVSTTTTAASPPSSIDERMVAPLQMSILWSDTSTTATQRYGCIMYDAVVAFRTPIANAVPIGVPRPIRFGLDEEKKVSSAATDPLTRAEPSDARIKSQVPGKTASCVAETAAARGWFSG
jgi:hypothetical protein